MQFTSLIVALGLIATVAATPIAEPGYGYPVPAPKPAPAPAPAPAPVVPIVGSGNGNGNVGVGNGNGNGIVGSTNTNVCGQGQQTMCCSHIASGGFGINCLFVGILGGCKQTTSCCNSQNTQTGLVNINFGCSTGILGGILKE